MDIHLEKRQLRRLSRHVKLALEVLDDIRNHFVAGPEPVIHLDWHAWKADVDDAIGWLRMASEICKTTIAEIPPSRNLYATADQKDLIPEIDDIEF